MPRSRLLPLAMLAAAAAVGLAGGSAEGRGRGRAGRQSSLRHVRFDPDWEKHPSARYAAMTGAECTAELTRRGVAFTPVAEAPGVATPVRLPRDVGGVVYRTEAPAPLREASPYDVFDCRLVLALTDFSRVLKAHDVDEVRLFSAYRPGRHLPEGETGTRHEGGLAMDARRFGKRAGPGGERVWLDVEHDFHGRLGADPCGPTAAPPSPATPAARELRAIACAAADQHLFTTVLTPTYDRAHRNHFHLEVTPGVRWSLVR